MNPEADRRPTVLVDVDGVLADFTGGYLKLIEEFTGKTFDPRDVSAWNIRESPWFATLTDVIPNLRKLLDRHITETEGWCLGLEPLPGSLGGLTALTKVADVFIATSPWHSSKYWMYERTKWLHKHLGVPANRVIQANDKTCIWGDFLIDDKPKNIETWPHGEGLLWDTPGNRGVSMHARDTRVFGWDQVLDIVKSFQR